MKIGIVLKNSGPASRRELIEPCARFADSAGLDSLWVNDHIAIPPDDAEGSGGRYLDPLATLAFVAGVTERIGLGVGVLILPYRPSLATAKWVATIQELSGERLLLGVGVGWMGAEFRALGVDRSKRGIATDATLDFLHRCFGSDLVNANGQEFLFLPRPQRPPIFVGGAAPHAFRRALRYGEGWMPMGADVEKLGPAIEELHGEAKEAGRPAPEVITFARLPLSDRDRAHDLLKSLEAVGVTRVIHTLAYEDTATYEMAVEALAMLQQR